MVIFVFFFSFYIDNFLYLFIFKYFFKNNIIFGLKYRVIKNERSKLRSLRRLEDMVNVISNRFCIFFKIFLCFKYYILYFFFFDIIGFFMILICIKC